MDFSEVEKHYYTWLHFENDPILIRTLYSLVLANRWDSDPVWALVIGPAGSGKCLGRGTPVLLYDGSIVPVEEVRPGDQLMGPDSRPRDVLTTSEGNGPLFRICPVKGDPWICNRSHILTLVHTVTGAVSDVPLDHYLEWAKSKQREHKLFATGVDFESAHFNPRISPYFLGVWLGDGGKDVSRNGVRITKDEPAVLRAVQEQAAAFGLRVETDDSNGTRCPTHRIVGVKGKKNPLREDLKIIEAGGFCIPHRYLTAPRASREELLAGLLDTDGHLSGSGYDFVQKLKPIAEGAAFLARSLGLRVVMGEKVVEGVTYWRLSISGDCSGLPLRIDRKKAPPRRQKKNALRTGFEVEPIERGTYYGFTLNGDGRFLLGDFTVTHNTELLTSLTGSDTAVFVSTLTPYALASGFGDGSDSLLYQLDNNILIVEDMSAVTELTPDARNTLFSFLRSAYNGNFVRATGRGKIEWKGKFGMLGGATLAIESLRRMEGALGERFLYLRPRVNLVDQDVLLDKVLGSVKKKSKMRRILQNVASKFLAQPTDTKNQSLERSTIELVKRAAMLLSRTRTSAVRHSYTRDIEFPLEVDEMATRLLTQLVVIALAARSLGSDTDTVESIVLRLTMDSMPYVRARMLKHIHEGHNQARELAAKLKMSSGQVQRHLEELRLLDVLKVNRRREYEIADPLVGHAFDRQ